MSDFYTSINMLRGQVSDMLCDNPEQAMWVLADMATRLDAAGMQETIDVIDADPREVAQFFRELADAIDAGLEAETT